MKYLFRLMLALITVLSLQANATKTKLDVQLSVENTGNGSVNATLTITNNGNGNQKVLAWFTNLDEERLFKINRDGVDVAFLGRHIKRPAPGETDFIKLKSGQSLSKNFELTSMYDFSEMGTYEITYDVSSLQLFSNKGLLKKVERLFSASAYVWVEGIEAKKGPGKPCNPRKEDCGGDDPDPSGIEFTGSCSNNEKSGLVSALDAARNIADDSVSSLNGSSADRYNEWFGAYSTSRHNTVAGNFEDIKDALDNQQLTFDCSCNQSYFAYVYPNQPYKVYFCRAFWNANETGTDSRSGTIIHEFSHFNAVAGTDDIVYGQSGARSLAISNPNDAVKNADSHEYFAENTPHQN
ncbi:MAG: peptidase M35 [Alteromonadaceae bacterium]|nr:peptidase M35 [Alteromonadaceae bacterium]